jgi:hypothetical protein
MAIAISFGSFIRFLLFGENTTEQTNNQDMVLMDELLLVQPTPVPSFTNVPTELPTPATKARNHQVKPPPTSEPTTFPSFLGRRQCRLSLRNLLRLLCRHRLLNRLRPRFQVIPRRQRRQFLLLEVEPPALKRGGRKIVGNNVACLCPTGDGVIGIAPNIPSVSWSRTLLLAA